MLDRIILIFSLYIPFQVALNPLAGVDLASIRVFALLLFFLWLAKSLIDGKILIPFNVKSGMLVSFLIVVTISALWGTNHEWSLRKLIFWFSLAPLYWVCSSISGSLEKVKKILSFLVLGGAVAAFVGIAQFIAQFIWGLEKIYRFWSENLVTIFLGQTFSQSVLENPSWLVNIGGKTYLRAIAFFPDPHMFSFYLGMLAPLALGLSLDTGIKKRFFWILSLVLIIIADLLTFSRGGYLGLFVGAVIFIVWFWKYLSKSIRKYTFGFGLTILLIMLVPSPISQRFYSSFNQKEGSNVGRIATWKKAMDVISNNWLGGVGVGNYPLAIKPSAQYREPIYAHNAYLDIAADSGIIALFAWVGFIVFSVAGLIKKGRKFGTFIFIGIGLIIFSIHSLVETGIYSPAVLALLFMMAGFSNIEFYEKTMVAKN